MNHPLQEAVSTDGAKAAVLAHRQPLPTRVRWLLFGLPTVLLGSVMLALLFLSSAPNTTGTTTLSIPEGASIKEIATLAADTQIVRSGGMLYFTLLLFHKDQPIQAGNFTFDHSMNVLGVADFLTSTAARDDLVRLTFPEGMRTDEYALIVSDVMPDLSVADFMLAASSSEGELWPETYYVPTYYTAFDIVKTMRDSFQIFAEQQQDALESSGYSFNDWVILASIVEREANDEESMRTVAGILSNRLALGMPLQADATIAYVLDTDLKDLPTGKLAELIDTLDSPYNTYKYAGLPPTPIGNPGATALLAVLNPIKSDYIYYLTDDEGNFHYAVTLEEHNRNVTRYLK